MLELFNKLNQEEILQFEKIINSPYFNTVENVVKLFYYLKSLHPFITKEDLSADKLSKTIYGKKSVTPDVIWKVKSDFSKVFEKFLVQVELENDTVNFDLTLLKALRKKGSKKEIELLLNKIKKNRKKLYNKDDSYYLNNASINEEEYYNRMPGILYEFPESLQSKSDNLDLYFLFTKFHAFYEMLVHQYHNGKPLNFNKPFFNDLINFVKINTQMISKDHPNIYVIYLVLMMFTEKENDKYPNTLKKYLKINESNFSQQQLSYYYRYLESYFHFKINEGQNEFRKDAFEIYKIMFDKDLFILENKITDKEFNNVINISLPLEKYQWTRIFIEKFKDYIQPELAIESYNLAKAKYYFYTKEFKKVFPHLNLIHYRDPHYYINSKVLLGKVLYETNSFDTLKSMLESLRKYLSREKNLTEQQLSGIKNYIKFIAVLARIKEENRKEELTSLVKLIDKEKKFISSKSWFTEKIGELMTQ